MRRRQLLRGLAATGAVGAVPAVLSGCSSFAPATSRLAPHAPLARIDARPDRLTAVTVCTRPFRSAGPRIEAERLGAKTLVHCYGHGGSGWSLSWGSAERAVALASASGSRELAVIGCGAIGLTTAIVAQRAGFAVTIYAESFPPDVRSMLATGVWSPNSRFCTAQQLTPALADQWEQMARRSWWHYQNLLGLPGEPVEWAEQYQLSSEPWDQGGGGEDGEPEYPHLERDRTPDLRQTPVDLATDQHPFALRYVRRVGMLMFNLSAYVQHLLTVYRGGGGRMQQRRFATPADLADLRETIVVNATGYGARALFGDDSVIPVRGQLARLVPQPEVRYGINCGELNLNVVPRRDGLIVQAQAAGDFGSSDARPDRAASEAAVARLASIYRR